MRTILAPLALSLAALAPAPAAAPAGDVCAADVEFALAQLEQRCGHFFRTKDIDWKKVEKELTKAAKAAEDDAAELEVLLRLLARLEDGHAEVRPLAPAEGVSWPEELTAERRGPGLFLCTVGKAVRVKSAWGEAAELGIEPGAEVVKIDGEKAAKWVDARTAAVSELRSFSTDHQARFYAMHWGMAHAPGTRLELELKTVDGKKRKRTVTCTEKGYTPQGPAFPVAGFQGAGESVGWARTPAGNGYVHVRRVREDVIDELDAALAAVGDAPGLVLDFRGNSGGGCDHDAFEARFVPAGGELERLARGPLASAGPNPYAGPLVVIVDATCRSSGETLAGMFKEDGRGYMIGDSPTAGMSSQKETIELPSGRFALYVSVGSNRSSFNGGRGIEGIGVAPMEHVEYDPEDLAAGVDTMLRRADELLADFPQKAVRYEPPGR